MFSLAMHLVFLFYVLDRQRACVQTRNRAHSRHEGCFRFLMFNCSALIKAGMCFQRVAVLLLVLSGETLEVAPFINQLSCSERCFREREYLVNFIINSQAGFIASGVTVTMNGFLRQMATLSTLVSGLAGVLLRKLV